MCTVLYCTAMVNFHRLLVWLMLYYQWPCGKLQITRTCKIFHLVFIKHRFCVWYRTCCQWQKPEEMNVYFLRKGKDLPELVYIRPHPSNLTSLIRPFVQTYCLLFGRWIPSRRAFQSDFINVAAVSIKHQKVDMTEAVACYLCSMNVGVRVSFFFILFLSLKLVRRTFSKKSLLLPYIYLYKREVFCINWLCCPGSLFL